MKKTFFIIVMFTLLYTSARAQYGTEFGVLGGVSNYFGDLNTHFSFKGVGPHASLFVRHNFTPRFSMKLAGNWGKFHYNDSYSKNPYQQARNLSFRNTLLEGDIQFELNFLPIIHGDIYQFYTPYLFAGAGAMLFKPQTKYNGEWVNLNEIYTEGKEYSLQQLIVPVGLGFKYDIRAELSLNIEAGWRFMFVDYLDDVSEIYTNDINQYSNYPQLYQVLKDRSGEAGYEPIGKEGKQRGEWNNNDQYAFIGIGLTYNIAGVNCPRFGR